MFTCWPENAFLFAPSRQFCGGQSFPSQAGDWKIKTGDESFPCGVLEVWGGRPGEWDDILAAFVALPFSTPVVFGFPATWVSGSDPSEGGFLPTLQFWLVHKGKQSSSRFANYSKVSKWKWQIGWFQSEGVLCTPSTLLLPRWEHPGFAGTLSESKA